MTTTLEMERQATRSRERRSAAQATGRDLVFHEWLARNGLQLLVALLLAVSGWSFTRTLDEVRDSIRANTAKLEATTQLIQTMMVEQTRAEGQLRVVNERLLDHEDRLRSLEAHVLSMARAGGGGR